jgi:hypothetical protein
LVGGSPAAVTERIDGQLPRRRFVLIFDFVHGDWNLGRATERVSTLVNELERFPLAV